LARLLHLVSDRRWNGLRCVARFQRFSVAVLGGEASAEAWGHRVSGFAVAGGVSYYETLQRCPIGRRPIFAWTVERAPLLGTIMTSQGTSPSSANRNAAEQGPEWCRASVRSCKHKIGLCLCGILGDGGRHVAKADFDAETVS